MEAKKNKKGAILALIVLAAVVAGCLTLYFVLKPTAVAGSKTITVQVVHGDGSSKDFVLATETEFLGDALVEGGVVVDKQGPYGLYFDTADGEFADEARQEWWCLTKDGGQVNLGASQQPIADGEHYELTFTVGYDM